MIHVFLYLVSMGVLIPTLIKVYRVVHAFEMSGILSICIYSGFLLYMSSLIPGIFSVLYPATVTLTLLLLCGLSWVVFSQVPIPNRSSSASIHIDPDRVYSDLWNPTALLIGALGILGMAPIAKHFLKSLVILLFPRRGTLDFDIVSYHLPIFIEFLQNHSIWPSQNPKSFFHFGFELIGGFPSYFFLSHWGIILANGYANIFHLAAVFILSQQLLRHFRISPDVNPVTIGWLAMGIWSFIFQEPISWIGKNDVFGSACILASLWCWIELLQTRNTNRRDIRNDLLLAFSMLSCGLAIATKPNIMIYLPLYWGVLIIYLFRSGFLKMIQGWGLWFYISIFIGPLIMAGFFPISNYISHTYDCGQSIFSLCKSLTVIANLNNPNLYRINRNLLVFGVAIGTPLILMFFWKYLQAIHEKSWIYMMIFIFFGLSLVAFMVMPCGLFPDYASQSGRLDWQLRLCMPFITLAICVDSALFGWLAAKIPLWRNDYVIIFFLTIMGMGIVGIPVIWHFVPIRGLPGFENIKGLPTTHIYQWIQNLESPLRIYSAGLRPYGLYGKNWENRVIYDSHSSILMQEDIGKTRIANVVHLFKPNLILISIEPINLWWVTNEKPLLLWMKSLKCFEEAYADETVSAFKVLDNAETLLKEYLSPEPSLCAPIFW